MRKAGKIAICALLCMLVAIFIYCYIQYAKWEKYHEGITDKVIYADMTDKFRLLCSVDEISQKVKLRVYYSLNSKIDSYDYTNSHTHIKELSVDISDLLSEDAYVELAPYGTFDEENILVSDQDQFEYFKYFDNKSKLLDCKYLVFPCDSEGYISMCDINTGKLYYGLECYERFDLNIDLPKGYEQRISPISILLSDDKIVVIYKYLNKIYIRRIN